MLAKLPSKLEAELNAEFKFTAEHNHEAGLLNSWDAGRIFVNPAPPYRQGSVELYINKALRCNAELVVLLVPCDVSTEWFNNIWELSEIHPHKVQLRFFRGRIKYESEEASRFAHRIPSCLVIISNGRTSD
jgi:hypothetical protein